MRITESVQRTLEAFLRSPVFEAQLAAADNECLAAREPLINKLAANRAKLAVLRKDDSQKLQAAYAKVEKLRSDLWAAEELAADLLAKNEWTKHLLEAEIARTIEALETQLPSSVQALIQQVDDDQTALRNHIARFATMDATSAKFWTEHMAACTDLPHRTRALKTATGESVMRELPLISNELQRLQAHRLRGGSFAPPFTPPGNVSKMFSGQ